MIKIKVCLLLERYRRAALSLMEFRFGVILRHSGFRQMGGVFSQFQPHMIVLSGSKALYVTTFSRVQMNIYKKSLFSENLHKITYLAGFYCQIKFSFSI